MRIQFQADRDDLYEGRVVTVAVTKAVSHVRRLRRLGMRVSHVRVVR